MLVDVSPERCQRIRVSTAKLCLRSCTRGRTVAVRTPMAMVIFLNVLSTPLRVERGADGGEEERPRSAVSGTGGHARRRSAQRFGGRRVQRHQPGAVELRVPDRDDTGLQVDVVALEASRLAEAHAARRRAARTASRESPPAAAGAAPALLRAVDRCRWQTTGRGSGGAGGTGTHRAAAPRSPGRSSAGSAQTHGRWPVAAPNEQYVS